jgi:energy-coupling factor transport system ATP-binding protein
VGLIEIEDVTFSYSAQPEAPALHGLTCRIEQGSFVGITGLGEAGKSSFCRLIAGYIPHFFDGDFSGRVRVDGIDTRETTIGELSSKVGFVFENPFDQLTGASLTVLEEVAFGLENLGLPRREIESRATESLDQVGIGHLLDRHPLRLSGGQSQRLALASVLAARPEIFVLDEPTSQLDPLGAEEVFGVAADLHRRGYTVLLVSQDLDRLAVRADRLIVLDDGRVRWDGDPREVLSSAAEARYPVLIPDVLEIGRRVRRTYHVDASRPLPLTVEQAADELALIRANTRVTSTHATSIPKAPEPTGAGSGSPIVFEDVHYAYTNGTPALQGVSLGLDGGCVCIIGQNGAGKTTLTKHLNGLLKPTSGRVLVRGKDTREYPIAELARDVGLAFQNPDSQLFCSTVEEEVAFGAANVGASPQQVRGLTEAAIELMKLDEIRGKKPYDLGLSERKRVAIASVLAMDTPVVVLDEPTGGQDALGIALLGDLIGHLMGEGKLVVVVTHDVKFASAHADRVVAMYKGRVLLDGGPRTVFGKEEVLARTHVEPPPVTRLGRLLWLDRTILYAEELLDLVSQPQKGVV